MTERQSSQNWRQPPLLAAAVIAVGAIALGYDRSLALTVWAVVVVLYFASLPWAILTGIVLCLVAGLVLRPAFAAHRSRRMRGLAAAIILASPLLTYFTWQLGDQVRFLAWAPFHQDLLRRVDKDGVVTFWDDLGGFGVSTELYLVRNNDDKLTSFAEAEAWRTRLGLPCEIDGSDRVWPTLYVVTTSGCDLEKGERGP